jgi:hypothetical protein
MRHAVQEAQAMAPTLPNTADTTTISTTPTPLPLPRADKDTTPGGRHRPIHHDERVQKMCVATGV